MHNNDKGLCDCSHHSVIPILIILFATAFLLHYQGFLAPGTVEIIWPIIVGIGGIVKLMEDKCSCC